MTILTPQTMNLVLVSLVTLILQLYAAVLLLRFHLLWLKVPIQPKSTIGSLILTLTDFWVRVRRFIPSTGKCGSAFLLLSFCSGLISIIFWTWVWLPENSELDFAHTLPFWVSRTIFNLIVTSFYLLFAALALRWLLPDNYPEMAMLNAVVDPFLKPVKRGVDLCLSLLDTKQKVTCNVHMVPFILFFACMGIIDGPLQWLRTFSEGFIVWVLVL